MTGGNTHGPALRDGQRYWDSVPTHAALPTSGETGPTTGSSGSMGTDRTTNLPARPHAMAMKPPRPVGPTATVGADDGTTIATLDIRVDHHRQSWSAPPDGADGAPVTGLRAADALHEAPGAWAQAGVVGDVETTIRLTTVGSGPGLIDTGLPRTTRPWRTGKPDPKATSASGQVPDIRQYTLVGAIPVAVINAIRYQVSPAKQRSSCTGRRLLLILWVTRSPTT